MTAPGATVIVIGLNMKFEMVIESWLAPGVPLLAPAAPAAPPEGDDWEETG
jgi:hypothetical protein